MIDNFKDSTPKIDDRTSSPRNEIATLYESNQRIAMNPSPMMMSTNSQGGWLQGRRSLLKRRNLKTVIEE